MAEEKKPAVQAEDKKADNAKAVKKAPVVATNASRKKEEAPDAEESIESALNKAEGFILKNGKSLLTALVVVVLIVGGFLAYKYMVVPGRNQKAGEMMFVAEQMFAVDSFEVALNGDHSYEGFLDVIAKYGSTAQGNVAKHYAGVCYLKLGDTDAALEYLAKYKHVKGFPAQIINAQNIGLQGDIYADKGDYAKAAAMYKKAVEVSDNSFTAPIYLKKEGLAYGKLGKTKESIAAFQKIVDLYPASMEVQDAYKFMGAEEQK